MFKPLTRRNCFLFLLITVLSLSFLFFLPGNGQCINRTFEERKSLPWEVKITFGIRGPKPLVWDGKASMNEGQIETIEGINFTEKDKLFPKTFQWQCTIDRLRGREISADLKGISPREYLEERVAKGIILHLHAPRSARLSIATKGGVFSVCLADLILGEPLKRLENNVKIELAPRSFIFSEKKAKNNYSAVAIDSASHSLVCSAAFGSLPLRCPHCKTTTPCPRGQGVFAHAAPHWKRRCDYGQLQQSIRVHPSSIR